MAKNSFEVIDELRDEDGMGVIASITKREHENGFEIVSWALYKEYEPKPGVEMRRTNFLNERHIASAINLLRRVRERMRAEKDRSFDRQTNV